jgi:hypothetical protein
MRAPISVRCSCMFPQFSDLPCYVFGELNALLRLRCIDGRLLRNGNSGRATAAHETFN